MKSVSNNANASLFVDDLAVYIEGKHLKHLERSMQLCINKIQKWVAENLANLASLKQPVSIGVLIAVLRLLGVCYDVLFGD